MHYELYFDSLFLLNFGMNLLLLILVDHSTCHTATWYRLTAGAAIGAVCYLLPFLWKGTALLKLFLCLLPGTGLMLWVAFPIRNMRGFWLYFRKQCVYTFLMGGALAAVFRSFPAGRKFLPGTCMVLGVGALFCIIFLRHRKKEEEHAAYCQVFLRGTDGECWVPALIDSGNTLREPISGAPVSVVDARVFKSLWREEPSGFRAIPYHSVGKNSGILSGYPVPQITIRYRGVEKVYRNVYLAVSEEEIAGKEIPMLLHPALLQPGDRKEQL